MTRNDATFGILDGDRVEFTARGAKHVGTVVLVRFRKYRGRRKELAQQFEQTAGKWVAEVVADGETGVWTASVSILKRRARRATKKQMAAAQAQRCDVKEHNRKRKHERRERGEQQIDDNNLVSLLHGDKIEVNYRDIGWTEREFMKFSRNGRVGYLNPNNGKVRYTGANHVRKIKGKQKTESLPPAMVDKHKRDVKQGDEVYVWQWRPVKKNERWFKVTAMIDPIHEGGVWYISTDDEKGSGWATWDSKNKRWEDGDL